MIGRLVRDPELRTTNTGKSVVEFTIAVDKRIRPTDPNQPTADFFRCKAWNQTAEFLSSYAGKGRLLSVDGRLETRKYVDKDGNNRELVEIVADQLNLLDRPREDTPAAQEPAARELVGAGAGRGKARGKSAPDGEFDPFAD